MTVRINKQKINLREKLTEFEDKVNFDEVVRGLGEYTGNVGIGVEDPGHLLHIKSIGIGDFAIEGTQPRIWLKEVDQTDLDILMRNHAGQFRIDVTEDNGNLVSTPFLINNTDGHVGIGTTNPGNLLHVQRNTTSNAYAVIENTTAGNAGINLKNASGDWNIVANADLRFIDNAVGAGDRMRIDSAGNVGIGTTNPGAVKLVVHGSLQCIQGYRSTSTSTQDLFTLNSDVGTTNSTKFKIEADGTAYTGSTPLSSDDRLKHNEQEIFGAIETLSKITPKKYIKTSNLYEPNHDFQLDESGNPIDENGKLIAHHIEAGVIAQQVLNVPELKFLVREEKLDEDGNTVWPYSLDYNSLFTYAIAAIQEQQSIIEDLKSRIETLESK